MSYSPLVSIVLPTYNGHRFLGESIESCLRQSFRDWELIIVDDTSTDETPAVIAKYATSDSRIRPIRNESNLKLPKSLNRGFAHARGDFLTWTSDDNCYRPEALGTMLDHLAAYPGLDVVYANFTMIDEKGMAQNAQSQVAGPLQELPLRNAIGPCFLYRRAVHEKLGGYAEDLFLAEDYDFWLRASTIFQFGFIEQDLYIYRRHSNSLTATRTQNIRLAREAALARSLPRMAWMDGQLRSKAYRDLITKSVDHGDRRAARGYLLQSLRQSPGTLLRIGFTPLVHLLLPSPLCRLVPVAGKQAQWRSHLSSARKEIATVIPKGRKFILVDEEQLRGDMNCAHAVPFLEKDGKYWGMPADDETAIREVERLRSSGADFMVFAPPAFWWFEHYKGLNQFLRNQFPCVTENKRLVVFQLAANMERV